MIPTTGKARCRGGCMTDPREMGRTRDDQGDRATLDSTSSRTIARGIAGSRWSIRSRSPTPRTDADGVEMASLRTAARRVDLRPARSISSVRVRRVRGSRPVDLAGLRHRDPARAVEHVGERHAGAGERLAQAMLGIEQHPDPQSPSRDVARHGRERVEAHDRGPERDEVVEMAERIEPCRLVAGMALPRRPVVDEDHAVRGPEALHADRNGGKHDVEVDAPSVGGPNGPRAGAGRRRDGSP